VLVSMRIIYLRYVKVKYLEPGLRAEFDLSGRYPWETVLLLSTWLMIAKAVSRVCDKSTIIPRWVFWLRSDGNRPKDQNQDCMYGVYRKDGADDVTAEEVLIRLPQTLKYSWMAGMVPARDHNDCPKENRRLFGKVMQR